MTVAAGPRLDESMFQVLYLSAVTFSRQVSLFRKQEGAGLWYWPRAVTSFYSTDACGSMRPHAAVLNSARHPVQVGNTIARPHTLTTGADYVATSWPHRGLCVRRSQRWMRRQKVARSPSAAAPPSLIRMTVTVEFSGRVVNPDAGGPVANVQVSVSAWVFPAGRLRKAGSFPKDIATSGGDGTFTLPLNLPEFLEVGLP